MLFLHSQGEDLLFCDTMELLTHNHALISVLASTPTCGWIFLRVEVWDRVEKNRAE
jgi:hypothetical protein